MPDSPKNDVTEAELQLRIKVTSAAITAFEQQLENIKTKPASGLRDLQIASAEGQLFDLRTELEELKQGVVTHE